MTADNMHLGIDASVTHAIQDYLKIIFKAQRDGMASTNNVARAMGVSAASATAMIKRLAGMNLVDHKSYQGVRLTRAGEKIALHVLRHHRLLETYLREALGYPLDRLHDEACALEHHISEMFEDTLAKLLGEPTHDPHGHPIPTRTGRIIDRISSPLAETQAGREVEIHSLDDEDPELLRYFEAEHLLPGERVLVHSKAPVRGPIELRRGRRRTILGYETATRMFVVPISE